MTDNAVPIDEWLSVISDEYLSTFVKDGGAAVKFAVAAEERRVVLREALKSRCEDLGYVFVALDAAECRVHMPQDVLFGLTSRIDWRLLARRTILISLKKMDYRVDDIDPSDDAVNVIDAVARINGLESQSVLHELRPDLEREITKNPNLTKAFRVAMLHLCWMERKATEPRHYAGQPLLDWLTGADTRIGNVRSFNIYTRIDRTTARYFIESAFHWVRQAGYAGTVLLLDNARVTLARNPRDGRRYYTRAMTIDHYELLRELIDDVDRLSGALLAVVTDREFIDEQSKRGYGIYDALRTRVMNDVRDRNLANPVASLIRLS